MSIAPNPADLPSPANRYRLPERAHATSDLFNLVFGSIGARLDAAEGKSADYDAAIDRIIGQALQTVSAALTVEIEAGRAEFEAVREAFEELQSGGFSAARIAATLNGHPTVTHVQGALTTLLGLVRDLDALLPDVGETDGLKFLRAKADRSGFELAEVDLYSAALMQRVARSANTQIVKADKGSFFDLSGSFVQTFASAATLGAGWFAWVRSGTGAITLDPAGSEQIDGASTVAVGATEVRLVICTGAGFVTMLVSDTRARVIAEATVSSPVLAVAFTNLTANDYFLDIRGIRSTETSTIATLVEYSTNNGGTWSTLLGVGNLPPGQPWNYAGMLSGLQFGNAFTVFHSGGGAVPWTTAGSLSNTGALLGAPGPINALRFRVNSATVSLTAGTFRLIGRP